jgi:urease accessory protein UreH
VRARTLVELSGTARFTGWEIHCLGRPAIGERFATGTADFLLNVQRDCRPLLRDRLRVSEGTGLDGPSGLRGFPVCGTFVATGAGPQDLDAAREILPHERGFPIGLTLIEDLIVARCLAPTAEPDFSLALVHTPAAIVGTRRLSATYLVDLDQMFRDTEKPAFMCSRLGVQAVFPVRAP